MQTTTTTKGVSISYYLAAIAVVGTLALVIMVLAANGIDNIGSGAREAAAPVADSQPVVTSDELFALEAAHDATRVRGTVGAVVSSDTLFAQEAAHDASRIHDARYRLVTSDVAYTLEAAQVAQQQAAQAAQARLMTVSSDALFALEASYELARAQFLMIPQITSDTAYAIEAAQVAEQQAAQAERAFISSDDLFAIEEGLAELNRR